MLASMEPPRTVHPRRKPILIGMLALTLLSAAFWFSTTWPYRIIKANLKSKQAFTHCTGDPRIWCEPGSDALAAEVARHLDTAIATIERTQFGRIALPVNIYTYASHASFAEYTGMSEPRAAVFNGAMHVSPVSLRANGGLAPTLVHEMSHLQLNLELGTWAFGGLPTWFSEGLATHLSGGAGAEMVNETGAVFAMEEGKCMTPAAQGSRLSINRHVPQVNRIDMLYRQGAMFIAYLEQRNSAAFKAMLEGVARKQTVGKAIGGAYGLALPALWGQFLEKARADFNGKSKYQAGPLCRVK